MAIVEVHPVPIDGPWSATAGQEAGSPPEHVSPQTLRRAARWNQRQEGC